MTVFNIRLKPNQQGLHDFTSEVSKIVSRTEIDEGLCTLFIKHTSCSLIIQENADPSARADLENGMNQLVKESDPIYTHTLEGPDDMPAHIKSVLTASSLSIPILDGKLCLGTWQGIYLWEHRHYPAERTVIVHLGE